MTSLQSAGLAASPDLARLEEFNPATIRNVRPEDAAALQGYFRGLSVRSRYNRFLGALSELPSGELDRFVHFGRDDRFSILAVTKNFRGETLVGEARYAIDPETGDVEFGLSIDDRWQGRGIGSALMRQIECRAGKRGALRLFGDTLRANNAMIGLAGHLGYAFGPRPRDWKLVRLEKAIVPTALPCGNGWETVAARAEA